MLFVSAKFGRDEKRGAMEAIHATFSRNAKKKGRIKKRSHGTQLLEGGEVGALLNTSPTPERHIGIRLLRLLPS